jgi:hypothetical protein
VHGHEQRARCSLTIHADPNANTYRDRDCDGNRNTDRDCDDDAQPNANSYRDAHRTWTPTATPSATATPTASATPARLWLPLILR